MFNNAISPAEWGARVDYDTWRRPQRGPDKWVIHWGGYGNEAGREPYSVAVETKVLRAWEAYHINGRGWSGIGYNYAIGQTGTVYRLRGENQGAHTLGDIEPDNIPENMEARGVVFILGVGQKPTLAALTAFSKMWNESQLPVYGHQQAKATACPGPDLMTFIRTKSFVQTGGTMTFDEVAKLASVGLLDQQFVPTREQVKIAVAIARAESGLRPTAQGDTGIQTEKWGPSMGLWQIRSLKDKAGTNHPRDATQLLKPEFNARAMWIISAHGTYWQPWSVWNHKSYEKYLPEAEIAVTKLFGPAEAPPLTAQEVPFLQELIHSINTTGGNSSSLFHVLEFYRQLIKQSGRAYDAYADIARATLERGL